MSLRGGGSGGGAASFSSLTVTGQGLFADGTAALPSIAFAAQPSTGIYRPTSGRVGFSAITAPIFGYGIDIGPAGAAALIVRSNGFLGFSSAADPLTAALDAGFSRGGVGVLITVGTGSINPSANGASDFGASNIGYKRVYMDFTNTGTVGAVTINKAAGRVNIAAAGTSVVVTNSLVTANSLIFCTIATNDATAQIKNVVAGAGTFTITVIAVTAQTAINFFVVSTD